METDDKKCYFGTSLKEDCFLTHYVNEKLVHNLQDLEKDDLEILLLRTPTLSKDIDNETICSHHLAKYGNYYSNNQRVCVDPWVKHNAKIRNKLKEIDLNLMKQCGSALNICLIPGQKLCRHCFNHLQNEIANYEEKQKYCCDPFKKHRTKIDSEVNFFKIEHVKYLNDISNLNFSEQDKVCRTCEIILDNNIAEYKKETVENEINLAAVHNNEPQNSESTPESVFESNSQKKRKFDEVLCTLDISPFKKAKLSDKRLQMKGMKIVQCVTERVTKVFEEAYNIKLPDAENLSKTYNESGWFKEMMSNIKSRLDSCETLNEKVRALSVLPENMRLKDVNQYFQCSYYMFSEAKKLKQSFGTLAPRIRKSYLKVLPEIRDSIVNFYLDEKNTIMTSGMKECLKIKINGEPSIAVQKRILIHDLPDLYKDWISVSGLQHVPCLAFFSQLRPKQCVFAGGPGTHLVCVCQIHQNIKLKLSALNENINYKELIQVSVCSVENRSCMLQICKNCSGQRAVREYLSNVIHIENISNVQYSNWCSVSISSDSSLSNSRVSLQNFTEPFDKFLDNVSEDIWKMIPHHFISRNQKDYFNHCKTDINNDTGIFIMDFAENYTFLCQESTQGFYFNNQSATLFTAALYYKEESSNDLKVSTYCVISDTKKHEAFSVHIFMERVFHQIKNEFPWIKNLIEFSDGAVTQFKNKNHFSNLCFHEADFGFKLLSYNFFTTAHGKTINDGTGATAKRMARRLSMQGVHILSAKQMYDSLSQKSSDIRYLYVDKMEVEERCIKLQKRFKSARTITSTRKYHFFQPIDEKAAKLKLYAFDSESDIIQFMD